MGGIAVVHIAVQLQAIPHLLQYVPPQAVSVAADALRHQLHQQLRPQNEDVQAAVARRGVETVGRVGDAPAAVQPEIGVLPVAACGGAHRRDVRAGGNMPRQHVLQRYVDDRVAVRQHHIVLPDALEIVHHAVQRLYPAAELPVAVAALVIGEGGQQR